MWNRKTASLSLILSLTIIVLYMGRFEVRAAEQVLLEDDFESYSVGTFPSGGGWELWFNGAGNNYQIIIDNVADSPTKSLQLQGSSTRSPVVTNFKTINFGPYGEGVGSGASAALPFTTESSKIGFSVSVRVEEIGLGTGDQQSVATVAFGKKLGGGLARIWSPISFLGNGTIRVELPSAENPIGLVPRLLQYYVADRWYKVRSIIDRQSETFSVWIDDVLLGENLPVVTNQPLTTQPTSGIEAFTVGQFHNGVKVYFDDVKIFTVFDLDPKLELEPTTEDATPEQPTTADETPTTMSEEPTISNEPTTSEEPEAPINTSFQIDVTFILGIVATVISVASLAIGLLIYSKIRK